MRKLTILLFLPLVAAVCGCQRQEAVQEVQPVKVETMVAGVVSPGASQGYSGTIEEESGTALSFAGAGTLKSLAVSEGQSVAKGQLIATIDPQTMQNTVSMAQATTAQAQEALKQAQDAYERMKLLHDNGSLPEIQWIEVQTKLSQAQQMVRQAQASEQIARKGLTDTRLLAPFAGYVAQKLADVGQNVLPGSPVIRLVKIDHVKAKISVPEEEIAAFGKGMTMKVKVAALDGRTFDARVVEKGVSADPLSRTYEVKALISNARHELLPGMLCEVERAASKQSLPARIVLPVRAVMLAADNSNFVWTVADGKAVKTPVTVGENLGNEVAIDGGLQQGDVVIVTGQQKVSTGMAVVTQ